MFENWANYNELSRIISQTLGVGTGGSLNAMQTFVAHGDTALTIPSEITTNIK